MKRLLALLILFPPAGRADVEVIRRLGRTTAEFVMRSAQTAPGRTGSWDVDAVTSALAPLRRLARAAPDEVIRLTAGESVEDVMAALRCFVAGRGRARQIQALAVVCGLSREGFGAMPWFRLGDAVALNATARAYFIGDTPPGADREDNPARRIHGYLADAGFRREPADRSVDLGGLIETIELLMKVAWRHRVAGIHDHEAAHHLAFLLTPEASRLLYDLATSGGWSQIRVRGEWSLRRYFRFREDIFGRQRTTEVPCHQLFTDPSEVSAE